MKTPQNRKELDKYVQGIVFRMVRRGCEPEAIMEEVDRCCASLPDSLTAHGMNPRDYCEWALEDAESFLTRDTGGE